MNTGKVRAQFWVRSVERQAVSGGNIQRRVVLAPVVRSTGQPGYNPEGNVDWSKYTPSGSIEMIVTQDGAGEWFEERVSKDVAITFSDPEPVIGIEPDTDDTDE